jgi:phosphoribosylcarboxyaminoimidazole (NCAIR) mutase
VSLEERQQIQKFPLIIASIASSHHLPNSNNDGRHSPIIASAKRKVPSPSRQLSSQSSSISIVHELLIDALLGRS